MAHALRDGVKLQWANAVSTKQYIFNEEVQYLPRIKHLQQRKTLATVLSIW